MTLGPQLAPQNLPGQDFCGANRGPGQGVKLLLHGVRLTSPFTANRFGHFVPQFHVHGTEYRLVNLVTRKARLIFLTWHFGGHLL